MAWTASGQVPSNQANTEYAAMNSQYAAARDIDQAATTLDGGGICFLKLIQNTYRSQTMHLITDGRSSTCYYVMILIILIL